MDLTPSRFNSTHRRASVTPNAMDELELPLRSLSPRQVAVLNELAKGKPNKCIGKALAVSPETVKHHLKTIFSRLGVSRRGDAVRVAKSMELLK